MNFKRKKSKRSPKCTMCTQYSWYGNHKERHSPNERRKRAKAQHDLRIDIDYNDAHERRVDKAMRDAT